MIFPSVRAFPAAPLGKALVQWEYKPPYLKGLFIGGAVVAVFIALIYTFFAAPEQLDFLRSYASILLYIAVPLISFFFGKLILTTRKKYFVLYEKGFEMYIGETDENNKAGNCAPWFDFVRAELQDDGVKIYPKRSLQQSFFFNCTSNRLNVYGIVSGQIAQQRYVPFGESNGSEEKNWF